MTVIPRATSIIPVIGDEPYGQDSSSEIFNLTNVMRVLRSRVRLIACVMFVCLAAITAVTFTLTPRYTAEAIITLDERKNSVTDANAVLSGLTGDAATVQGQIQILRSRSLLARVIDKLHLQDDPALNPHRGEGVKFSALEDNGVFKWLMAQQAVWFQQPETSKGPGVAAQDAKNEVIDRMLRGLTISAVGASPAIEIKFSSADPEQAARVANAIAEVYIDDQLNAKLDATKNATKYLSDRLRELTLQVKTADAAVTRFRAENDLMDEGAAVGISSVDQQLAALNTQLITAQLSFAEQTARAERIQQARNSDTMPVVDSPIITQLRTEESLLSRQEAEISSRYGPRHPKMIDLQSQKASLERKIEGEVSRAGQAASNDADLARAKLRALQQDVDSLKRKAGRRNQGLVGLKQLEANAASSHSLYDTFLTQFKQIADREAIQRPDSRILSAAAIPKDPSFPPRKALILGAAVPASLFLGFMAAFAGELFVVGFRTSRQLEQTLALPVLATAPEVRPTNRRSTISNIVNENPVSPFAESMRGIEFGLSVADIGNPPKVILVTSSISREGKSTVALSLARTVARNGKNVVLMGCDFRRPELLRMVRAGQVNTGLVEALLGGKLADCLYKDPHSDVLLLAPETIVKDPSELLRSVQMENIIRDLREQADCIIIDSPPVLPVNDTKLLLRLIDTVVFVVQWEKTPREAAVAAVRSLTDLRAPIAGAVITRAAAYDYYGYGFQSYSNSNYTDEVFPEAPSGGLSRWLGALGGSIRWSIRFLFGFARAVIRLCGRALLVAAVMLLGADAVSMLEVRSLILRSLDKDLVLFGADAKPWIQTSFPPEIGNAIFSLLSQPGWAVLGIAGLVLALLGGRKKRKPAPPPVLHRDPGSSAKAVIAVPMTTVRSQAHEDEKVSSAEVIVPAE